MYRPIAHSTNGKASSLSELIAPPGQLTALDAFGALKEVISEYATRMLCSSFSQEVTFLVEIDAEFQTFSKTSRPTNHHEFLNSNSIHFKLLEQKY